MPRQYWPSHAVEAGGHLGAHPVLGLAVHRHAVDADLHHRLAAPVPGPAAAGRRCAPGRWGSAAPASAGRPPRRAGSSACHVVRDSWCWSSGGGLHPGHDGVDHGSQAWSRTAPPVGRPRHGGDGAPARGGHRRRRPTAAAGRSGSGTCSSVRHRPRPGTRRCRMQDGPQGVTGGPAPHARPPPARPAATPRAAGSSRVAAPTWLARAVTLRCARALVQMLRAADSTRSRGVSPVDGGLGRLVGQPLDDGETSSSRLPTCQ